MPSFAMKIEKKTVAGSPSCTVDIPVDPKTIVGVDALVLEKTSHPLQLAPFLLVINADKSLNLEPTSSNDWNPDISRVCGLFVTMSWSDENDHVQTHTIGLFAVHPSSKCDDLIVFTIDGKDHGSADYMECRNAAADMFKTRVMFLPPATPHSIHAVDFPSMHKDDVVNSSLHVRQCFRELAGMLSMGDVPVLRSLVSVGFSSNLNAFHRNACFEGVRVQIARRCWTKDLEDLTVCLLSGDSDLTRYDGNYGSVVTAPLTSEEEGLEVRIFQKILAYAKVLCDKRTRKNKCPTCDELTSPTARCGENCLNSSWKSELDDNDDDNNNNNNNNNSIALIKPQPPVFSPSQLDHPQRLVRPFSSKKLLAEREAAREVHGTQNVRINGVTGEFAASVNGLYYPTDQMRCNMTAYRKITDGDKWLEYNAGCKQWQVKSTADRGKRNGWASCVIPLKCLPEDCPPGQWRVYDGTKHYLPQKDVTICTVTLAKPPGLFVALVQ